MQFESNSNSPSQTHLDFDEKFDCRLLENGYALDVVGNFDEFAESKWVLLFKFCVYVGENGKKGTNLDYW